MYVLKYHWYYKSVTTHKILVHSADIINSFIVPIGDLSEEAQEARNKDFKYIRDHFSRRNSKQNTKFDLLSYLLVSSDPLITKFRRVRKIVHEELDPDALSLVYED